MPSSSDTARVRHVEAGLHFLQCLTLATPILAALTCAHPRSTSSEDGQLMGLKGWLCEPAPSRAKLSAAQSSTAVLHSTCISPSRALNIHVQLAHTRSSRADCRAVMKLHASYLQRELDPISSVLSLGDELLEVANLENVAHIVLDLLGCVGKVGPAECKRTCSEPPAVDALNR